VAIVAIEAVAEDDDDIAHAHLAVEVDVATEHLNNPWEQFPV
jgi:hypothetical protein